MAEQRQGATYFQFMGGLNTESSALNAPPADASALLNVRITEKGTVRPRKGVDFLESLTTIYSDHPDSFVVGGTYTEPAGNGTVFRPRKSDGTEYPVIITQVGSIINLYAIADFVYLTEPDDVLATFEFPLEVDTRAKNFQIQFAADANRIYLINPYLPLMYIEYNAEDDRFILWSETIYIRDYNTTVVDSQAVNDGKLYQCVRSHIATAETEPGVGADWELFWICLGLEPDVDPPAAWALSTVGADVVTSSSGGIISAYRCLQSHTATAETRPHHDPTLVGDSASEYWELIGIKVGDLLTDGWGFNFPAWALGSGYSGAGATEFDYLSSARPLDLIGIYGPGFSAGCMASGRLWVAGSPDKPNTIYYSQSILADVHYSRMFQDADPLSSTDSDIVDSDGGFIRLTAAESIVGLIDYRGGVLVLATNGVWYISGADGFFKPTDYSIKKLSDDGCVGRAAWSIADEIVAYAGSSYLYQIVLDEISGQPTVQPINIKIKSLWTGISHDQRKACVLTYNGDTSELVVGLNIEDQAWHLSQNPYNQPVRMRDFLIYKLDLKAWYHYQLAADTDGDKVAISGIFPLRANITGLQPVTDEAGEIVEDEFGEDVTALVGGIEGLQSLALVLTKCGDSSCQYSFGLFQGDTFTDFSRNEDDSESYETYIQSVPQVFSDIGHRKQVPYLHTAFELVEDGFDSETQTYTNPGACYYRILWNFSVNSNSKKYGQAYAAYRPTRYNLSYNDGTLPGYNVVLNRHRIRGTGKSVAFRFEGEAGKDFHLLGWQADIFASRTV